MLGVAQDRSPGVRSADRRLLRVTSGPLRDHIDTNILNLTGEQHRRLRALVGPAFLLTFGAGAHFCLGANLSAPSWRKR